MIGRLKVRLSDVIRNYMKGNGVQREEAQVWRMWRLKRPKKK